MTETTKIVTEPIESKIFLIRSRKVMLDTDLAALYEVDIKVLNQAVRRNIRRFPTDFAFELSKDEYSALRSQTVTLKTGRGQHRKYLPFVFTEQGVAMLSSVLRTERAIQVNIEIMRAFVRMRYLSVSDQNFIARLEKLEHRYDAQFKVVFDAIKRLIMLPEKKSNKIGFQPPSSNDD